MHNLKDSFLMAVITTYQTCFTWETELQRFTAILAFTIIWWCILTWWEEAKEKLKKSSCQQANEDLENYSQP